MSIGIWQVVLILVIVLIIFGAGKLPRVMGDVAKGIKNFKSGMSEEKASAADDTPKAVKAEAEDAVPEAVPEAAAEAAGDKDKAAKT